MRITDLINLLQENLKEHGDLTVGVYDNNGFYPVSDLERDVSIDTSLHDDHTESFPETILSITY